MLSVPYFQISTNLEKYRPTTISGGEVVCFEVISSWGIYWSVWVMGFMLHWDIFLLVHLLGVYLLGEGTEFEH